jgi:hypothetical protein
MKMIDERVAIFFRELSRINAILIILIVSLIFYSIRLI